MTVCHTEHVSCCSQAAKQSVSGQSLYHRDAVRVKESAQMPEYREHTALSDGHDIISTYVYPAQDGSGNSGNAHSYPYREVLTIYKLTPSINRHEPSLSLSLHGTFSRHYLLQGYIIGHNAPQTLFSITPAICMYICIHVEVIVTWCQLPSMEVKAKRA